MASKKASPAIFPRKYISLTLLAIITFLILLYSGISFSVADTFTKPNNNPVTKSATVISKNFEEISFITSDNITLKGWIFPGISNKAVIMVHGMWQNRLNEGYDGIEIAKELLDAGYTVMLFDLRGNGESEKTRIGYGFVEDRDLVAAVNVLKKKNFLEARIGIIGNSLGANTLIHAAPKLRGVGAMVVDSPTVDMKQLISDKLTSDKNLPRFLHPGIFFMAQHVFGIPVKDNMTISSMADTPERTYLFLHGEMDDYIPLENSKLLVSKANMFSKLVIFENAKHVETYKSNSQLYRETVFTFLEQQLGK